MMKQTVNARGHHNVRSTHQSTLEFTTERHLTPSGDCIFAVSSDMAMADLPDDFRQALKNEDSAIEMLIECGGQSDRITAYGHPELLLTHPTDFVIRKSTFICPRTLAISSDKAAADLDRALVSELVKGGAVTIKLEVS
jgi:uncharacterized protein